jgi:hypothetical protein
MYRPFKQLGSSICLYRIGTVSMHVVWYFRYSKVVVHITVGVRITNSESQELGYKFSNLYLRDTSLRPRQSEALCSTHKTKSSISRIPCILESPLLYILKITAHVRNVKPSFGLFSFIAKIRVNDHVDVTIALYPKSIPHIRSCERVSYHYLLSNYVHAVV